MLESPSSGVASADEHRIRATTAEVVLGIAGVAEIEPTLRQAVQNLAQQVAGVEEPRPPAVDGVQAVVHDDGSTDLTLEISVFATHQALATATQIRQRLRDTLAGLGHTPGRIAISILRIEREAGG